MGCPRSHDEEREQPSFFQTPTTRITAQTGRPKAESESRSQMRGESLRTRSRRTAEESGLNPLSIEVVGRLVKAKSNSVEQTSI